MGYRIQRMLIWRSSNCLQQMNNKPPEVSFGINFDELNNLYFMISHIEYFSYLFKNGSDGFIIDIVTKDQYSCSGNTDFSQVPFRGTTMGPYYYKN